MYYKLGQACVTNLGKCCYKLGQALQITAIITNRGITFVKRQLLLKVKVWHSFTY